MVRIIPMASSIRPSLSSSFRLCNNTTTSRPAAASLTSFISPPSRRLPFLSSAVRYSELFGLKPSKPCGQESTSFRVGAAGNMAQASTTTQENILDWVKQDNRRMLHVVYRVGDLDRTIKFYTECLGMKLLRKRDIPEERYTNAFLGEPGPVKGGSTVIAFIEDPDGYKFELLERGPTPEPLCQVMLRVGDLDRAIKFYEKAFGMELLRKRDNPEYKYTIAMMGYGPEDKNAVLELTYNYGVTEYEKGNAYAQIAIGTDDVYKTAEAVKLFGGKITREPGPLPGINTKITACLDPDGWKTVFVDNIDFLKELE
ncbi:Probable lactoylglutathione lyase, chloroplastic [Linum perenne]